ncbi:hypothetical protein BaRGS_00013295, partial [Batillaria attramentaria]
MLKPPETRTLIFRDGGSRRDFCPATREIKGAVPDLKQTPNLTFSGVCFDNKSPSYASGFLGSVCKFQEH